MISFNPYNNPARQASLVAVLQIRKLWLKEVKYLFRVLVQISCEVRIRTQVFLTPKPKLSPRRQLEMRQG